MIKGVLVELKATSGAPNVIPFQFNPETLRHSWTQPPASTSGSNPLAVQGLPGETFSFSLAMDVTDQLALAHDDPQYIDAKANGIYSRISALEMLMFPVPSTTGSGLTGSSAPSGGKRAVPTGVLPATLFVWGAGRILPVRVTSLTITEKLFDEQLHPTHADAQIELRVLTSTDLKSATGASKLIAAYNNAQTQRQALTAINLGTAVGRTDLPHILGT